MTTRRPKKRTRPQLIRMSPSGLSAFMGALAEPATAVPEMVKLLRRPAPWEPGYSGRARLGQ